MHFSAISDFMKRVLLLFLMFCFMLNNSIAYAAPLPEQADYLLPQCEEINEAQLRRELNDTIQKFLNDQPDVDFGKAVNQQWQTLKLDSVIDSEIDNAVLMVNNDAGLVNRFQSSWSPNKAEELANEVTQLAFNSLPLKNGLSQLSENMAEDLADKLEVVAAQSSSYAMDCLQKFIGSQYSQTFVDTFRIIIKPAPPQGVIPSLKPDTVQYINKHKFAFAGSAVFVAAITARIRKKVVGTIVNRVFQQVGERLLGRFATGVIPGIGEFLGVVLIAGDFVQSFEGALPEIQRNLKKPEIKQDIQTDIAKTIEQEIGSETSQLSREISNELYAVWLDFQKDYRETLSLAEKLPEFKAILSKKEFDLSRISSLVGVALNSMGRSQLIESIKDGSFERVLSLPEISYKILETTHDLSSLVAWTDLAGKYMEDVVNLELYKHLSPQDLDRQLLIELLDLKDPLIISKLSLLDIGFIRQLLSLSKQNLVALSKQLSSEDFQRLAGYLGNLTQFEKNHLVKFLINDDRSIIKNANVMAHIVQSRNIAAAIQFWESEKSSFSLLLDGTLKVLSGAISWRLIADKFGIPATLLFIAVPIVVLIGLLATAGIQIYRQLMKIKKAQKLLSESNAD
jgi:hypothetical protein